MRLYKKSGNIDMITKKIMIIMLLLVSITGYGFIKKITFLPGKNYTIKMVVTISSKSSLFLYYDSEKPKNPSRLFTYWFNLRSGIRKLKHVFILKDIIQDNRYYFKLEQQHPVKKVTKLKYWILRKGSKIPVIIK